VPKLKSTQEALLPNLICGVELISSLNTTVMVAVSDFPNFVAVGDIVKEVTVGGTPSIFRLCNSFKLRL